VIFGLSNAKHLDSLLRFMSGVFIPSFYQNSIWPDSIKNEFTLKLQRFMAHLNDTKWKSENKTVLYIPLEAVLTNVDIASKNKEMIQRLEMILIHWTRQIKELLSSQDALQLSEGSGPLEEIQFWSNRCDDLSGITLQLDKPGVKKVTALLQIFKFAFLNIKIFITLTRIEPISKRFKRNKLIKKRSNEGSLQAQSNLKFLKTMQNLCQDLANLNPSKIPEILPKILKKVRMIWVHSVFYNGKERITSLLRKLSNEVINRCTAAISLDNVFGGFVESSKKVLFECINCCESWKQIYNMVTSTHSKYSKHDWMLDQTGIFAQVDAFIQRCKDLVEVCDCQYHFSRAKDGVKIALPIFKGQRGGEILRGYLEIESIFEKNLKALIAVKKSILDVKAMSWLDDYSKLFINEINYIKRELSQKSAVLLPWYPKFAGQSLWIKLMKRRLERNMMLFDKAKYLPNVYIGDEIRTIYSQLCHSIDEFAMKNFYEWTSELSKDPYKLLDTPLLKRNVEKGLIDINYDESLLKSFREVHYWEKLSFEMPHYIYDASLRREAYRLQRENVYLVVREYNRIIALLSPEERGLFRERIMFLDRKILPGLTKITWSQAQTAEQFLQECRVNISRVQTQLDSYKVANMEIIDLCLKISELHFVKINQKRIYEDFEYQIDQTQHCKLVLSKMLAKHQEIVKIMLTTYEYFKNDGNEVCI
ncbi:hypothetical protein HELRODRAFT_66740, partial [Helobdella robusta]|uniref:Dynein heavy chain tail domain-containing protein n=1 Tax=Helobdella robusta TaxID=6412 RepID=T1FYQ3_HELRO